MSNLHTVIIHNISKMVGRMTVGLEQDWVIIHPIDEVKLIDWAIVPRLAIDQIIIHWVVLHLQPNHMRFTICCPLL